MHTILRAATAAWPAPVMSLTALAMAAGVASAQKDPRPEVHGPGGQGVTGCKMCHVSHASRPTDRALLTDRAARPDGWLRSQAPGAGPISLSCLRCHWTEDVRRGQPGLGLPPTKGVYLGADLSDDHPLGIVDPEIIAQRRAFDVPTDSRRRPTVLRSATVEAPLECTTCHAAHEQDARAPVGAEQFAACGTCHGEHVAGLGAHSAVSCTGCHQIHGARQRSLLFELNTEFLCARCHTSTGGAPTEWQEAHGVDEVALTVSPSHNAGSQCEECHAVHQ